VNIVLDDGQEAEAHGPDRDRIAVLLTDAQHLVRAQNYEGALELCQMAAALDPGRIELEGYVDLLRTRLVKVYREQIGDGRRIPSLLVPLDRTTRLNNLPTEAGFMLSLIDGRICFDELLSVSGMGPFEALRIVASLVEARIVGVSA
jgi:hypothetical protein